MNILKYFSFFFHLLFIFSNLFLWIWYFEIIFLQYIVILSWLINDDMCLFTQLEDYFFKQTLAEFLFNIRVNDRSKYNVPWYCRYSLYLINIIAIIYNIYRSLKELEKRLAGFT